MKPSIRIALASVAITAGLAVTGASDTKAGVYVRGSFPVPHGYVSARIGHPAFRVGTYVPVGYRVYYRPTYGYGFAYRDRWIPARRYRSQWRVCERPYVVADGYGSYQAYAPDGRPHSCDRDKCRDNDHRSYYRDDRENYRNYDQRYDDRVDREDNRDYGNRGYDRDQRESYPDDDRRYDDLDDRDDDWDD